MHKMLAVVVTLFLLSGCARSVLKSYEHDVYGVGTKDNPQYMKDFTECKNTEYSKGVLVNGELSKDVKQIDAYEKEYTDWFIDEAIKAIYTPGSGAYAGSTAAVAVSTGNTSNLNRSYTSHNSMPSTPKKYQDIKRARDARRACIESKGWKKPN